MPEKKIRRYSPEIPKGTRIGRILDAIKRGDDPTKEQERLNVQETKRREGWEIGEASEENIQSALSELPEVKNCARTVKGSRDDLYSRDLIVELRGYEQIENEVFVQAVSSGSGVKKFRGQIRRELHLKNDYDVKRWLCEQKIIVIANNELEVIQRWFREGLNEVVRVHPQL